MPFMCIICGAKKSIKEPDITLHRFPKNEAMRKKWFEAIGIVKINPSDQEVICSLHFDESSFHKTPNLVKLHDNAVPMSTNLTTLPVIRLFEDDSTNDIEIELENEFLPSVQQPEAEEDPAKSAEEIKNTKELNELREGMVRLRKICARQKKQVGRLHTQVLRRNKKIKELITAIKLIKQRFSQNQQK